jgi:hypothetical protein
MDCRAALAMTEHLRHCEAAGRGSPWITALAVIAKSGCDAANAMTGMESQDEAPMPWMT